MVTSGEQKETEETRVIWGGGGRELGKEDRRLPHLLFEAERI